RVRSTCVARTRSGIILPVRVDPSKQVREEPIRALYLNGKDLSTLPLIECKATSKKLLRRKRSRIPYPDHVERDGRLLFEQIVKMDLEGIVYKRKDSPYKVTQKPSRHWIKVKKLAVQPTRRREGCRCA